MSAARNQIMLFMVVVLPLVGGGATLAYSLLTGHAGARGLGLKLIAIPFAVVALGLLAAAVDTIVARNASSIHVFDATTGKRLRRRTRERWMDEAAIPPDGSCAACLEDDFHKSELRLEVRSLPAAEVLASRVLPRRMRGSVAISADRSTIAVRTWDAEVRGGVSEYEQHIVVLDGKTLEERATRVEVAQMYSMALSADGSRLLISGEKAGLSLYDVLTLERIASHRALADAAAFAPDGKRVAVAGAGGLTVRDAATLDLDWKGQGGHGGSCERACWSSDGSTIAIASSDRVTIWDAVTGALKRTIHHARGRALYLDLSPDGKTVAVG